MKKFKFRLEKLENIKGLEVDGLRQELAEAQAQLRKFEHDLIDFRESLDNTYTELIGLRMTQTDPLFLLCLESYAGIVREQISKSTQLIATQRQELAQRRDKLVEKHKEKRILEKNRERQQQKHSQTVERLTQNELDEVAQNAHQRHQS